MSHWKELQRNNFDRGPGFEFLNSVKKGILVVIRGNKETTSIPFFTLLKIRNRPTILVI